MDDEIYDDVDVTRGVPVSEGSQDNTASSSHIPAESSAYKTLLKQNVSNQYANINLNKANDSISGDRGVKRKLKMAKKLLLIAWMLFSTLLSLAALGVAITSIMTMTNEVKDYKRQLLILTEKVDALSTNGTG